MRLTLRTLLAWLDDTLPPEEVREIGKQVSETPYAQQLVERIRKVARRRRLTVPPSSGAEAVDPNMVAAYLDNELEADRVAELEKLCLSSDVHLAEVASCHQVLSLIKNKAKVPPESRYRMYRLIKGAEAVRTSYKPATPADRAHLASNEMPGIDSAGDGQPPWAASSAPRPSTFERFGPPLVAVALIVVLTLVGLLNLRYVDTQLPGNGSDLASNPFALANDRPEPEADAGLDAEAAEPVEKAARPDPIGPMDPDEAVPDSEPEPESEPVPDRPEPQAPAPMPDGVAAMLEETDGLALGANPLGASWDWQPHGAGDPLVVGELVVNLFPFRSTLGFGPVHLTMVGAADLRIAEPQADRAARFDLVDGRVVLRSDEPGATVGVGFEGTVVAIEPPVGQPLGLSWIGDRPPGAPSGRPILGLWTPEGTLTASVDGDVGDTQTFEGPVAVRFDPSTGTFEAEAAVMPDWVTDPGPSPAEEALGERFAPLFDESAGSITFALLEGTQGEDPEVRAAAVSALGAMSTVDPANLELVMPLLNVPDAPTLRSSAIRVLRNRIARGPEPADEVRALLRRFTDPPAEADELNRLLSGFGPEARKAPELFEQLVDDLASPNPSVRQLAIRTLRDLTGREALGYDPDQPEGPGLDAWQELLKSGRLTN